MGETCYHQPVYKTGGQFPLTPVARDFKEMAPCRGRSLTAIFPCDRWRLLFLFLSHLIIIMHSYFFVSFLWHRRSTSKKIIDISQRTQSYIIVTSHVSQVSSYHWPLAAMGSGASTTAAASESFIDEALGPRLLTATGELETAMALSGKKQAQNYKSKKVWKKRRNENDLLR